MVKKIEVVVCSLFAVMLLSCNYVFAEYQKAQEYRELLTSDTYLIEYTEMDENKNEDLKIGKIMMRDGNTYMSAERLISPNKFGFWGGLEQKVSNNPIAFYEEGKYYSFTNDDHALCVTEEVMKQKNYYIGVDWHNVLRALSVPNMFLPIMEYNKFNEKDENISKPVYVNSRTETIKKQIYNIDEYSSDVKNVAGRVMYKLKYSYYYNDKGLTWIRTIFIDNNGNEKIKGQIKINKIVNVLPDKMYKWKDKIKVTDLGEGDINELLGNNIHKKVEK